MWFNRTVLSVVLLLSAVLMALLVGLLRSREYGDAAGIIGTVLGLLGAALVARWQTARQLSASAELAAADGALAELKDAAAKVQDALAELLDALESCSAAWAGPLIENDGVDWLDPGRRNSTAAMDRLRAANGRLKHALDYWELSGGTGLDDVARELSAKAWDAVEHMGDTAFEIGRRAEGADHAPDPMAMADELRLRHMEQANSINQAYSAVLRTVTSQVDDARSNAQQLREAVNRGAALI